MSYSFDQPMRGWRQVDVQAVAGFAMSSAGFAWLAVELAARGWWGLATSGWELPILLGWLGASGWLSWWAYGWADGWWKAVAALGVALSVVALVVAIALLALRVLVENPELLDRNSKQRGGNRGRGRRRRR